MSARHRSVCPEALDNLDPKDPRALRARRDLRRVHRAMGSLAILRSAISQLRLAAPPKRILELGAGDGTLLLRLARTLSGKWRGVELTLLDRQRVIDLETIEGYRRLDWRVNVHCEDVLVWARRAAAQRYDLCIATLFLHHFEDAELRLLLAAVASRSEAFVASEPCRDRFANLGSRLIGLLGASAVTREDALKSVAAGFAGEEISAAWPEDRAGWWIREFRAAAFSHVFLAARERARDTTHDH
jgi:hypothetical protein